MRVAVFRAAADGRRTAARLAALGHVGVLAPVIRIVATGATVRAGDADGLIFTSAHAVEAICSDPNPTTSLREVPCWCVGARTAEAARTAGFTRVRTGPGTASDLAAALAGDIRRGRFVYVAGRDRKPDMECALDSVGLRAVVVEAYAAEAIPRWTAAQLDGLAAVACALHYSRRTAELAWHLAEAAGLGPTFRKWTHHCLSADVAAGLDEAKCSTLQVAEAPDEGSLLRLLRPA